MHWFRRPEPKELGNEAFKTKDLETAVAHYSTGLERTQGTAQRDERAKLLANRSAARAAARLAPRRASGRLPIELDVRRE